MWFSSRAKKELNGILFELEQFLKNNYKDQAHQQRLLLSRRCEALYAEGRLKEEDYLRYRRLYESYTEKMKNYHH